MNAAKLAVYELQTEKNCRKSVRWSAVPVPCLSWLCLRVRGEQGSGPKHATGEAFIGQEKGLVMTASGLGFKKVYSLNLY